MSTIDRETQWTLPTSTLSTSIGTGAAKNVDLSVFIGDYLWLASDNPYRPRAAAAASSLPTAGAMTSDMPFPAAPQRFLVTKATAHVAVFSDAGGVFYWARGEP